MFSRQLSLSSLIELCRSLRHYLAAGLTVRESFDHLAKKGDGKSRAVCARIHDRLKRGDDLEAAIKPESAVFPTIFHSLAGLGEQTGNLPEIFHELENYFRLQAKLRMQFLAQSIWPVLQFFAAIFVIAGMLLILGLIAPLGSKPFDPIGLGLTGPVGAAIFLGVTLGTVALFVIGIVVGPRLFLGGMIDGLLLRVPAVGGCLRALALSRYCLAQRLTLETAMPITTAVRLSLRATGNQAFAAAADTAVAGVRRGGELTQALTKTRLFPQEFLHVLAVGEESGRLTDVLQQQAEHYQEESSRRMTILTWVAGALVWLIVAVLIVIVVFRIFLSYLNLLDELSR
jgi:type IV pilus assembly protein PilC